MAGARVSVRRASIARRCVIGLASFGAILAAATGSAGGAARPLDDVGYSREPGSRSPVVSPDGAFVYTGAGDGIGVFARDAGTGMLTFTSLNVDASGAQSLALSADGAHLYATQPNGLVVFSRNATSGAVTMIQSLTDGVGGVNGLAYARHVVISPDGANVYAHYRLSF